MIFFFKSSFDYKEVNCWQVKVYQKALPKTGNGHEAEWDLGTV